MCRVGNPKDVTDLIRVGAHRAACVIVMMTEHDIAEEEHNDGLVQNGATLRVCLALRHVIFSNPFNVVDEENTYEMYHPALRIVMQMTTPSAYVDAACFRNQHADEVIIPVDLSLFTNTLMFNCATTPGTLDV